MNAKLYWHVHHDVLCELSADIGKRTLYIKTEKPEHERETRLRLMHEVKNPPALLLAAGIAREAAWIARKATWGTDSNQPLSYYDQVDDMYRQVCLAYDRVYRFCLGELEDLHETECPDCPWDGKTIFTENEIRL